ncbi:glycosyltransferase [Ectothiorhodospira marina]|uniref:Glycosyltransferase involved in cell wall bisynthesis n=1 Tax=Ectothiorhodospira marina TaxID=1396821 RepID=A0A1H7QLJ7_9GAMM|nr:glycosyltransferase [Ectothiorhodospira marina]SEL48494.1 Glycosyltransferase involved in cell wall bisynthesis [Ectothiorhodospira marina]
MNQRLTLLVPGDPQQTTGGYLYDRHLARELEAAGWTVTLGGLKGAFPGPDETAHRALDEALSALASGSRVLLDGLAMGALPEVIEAHADRLDLTALVHHPLGDESGLDPARRDRLLHLETRALQRVARIVVTSDFTARRLQALGLAPAAIHVAPPGVSPAPLCAMARGEPGPGEKAIPRLLCVAHLAPRKGHDVLLEALAHLLDLSWHCHWVGCTDRDLQWAATLQQQCRTLGLSARVTLHGELPADRVAAALDKASVFVLPSRYEGFGMVVTEALARGLPVITTTGGALRDTLPAGAGLSVPPEDPQALADALRRWLTQPALRAALIQGARAARGHLPDWSETARRVAQALDTAPKARDEGFARNWLDLRAGADARARHPRLAQAAGAWLRRRDTAPYRILDLGAGSGNNLRHLAPSLPGPQHWTLWDRDPALLDAAMAPPIPQDANGGHVAREMREVDLADLTAADLAGVHLVTASALLDLVSADWLKQLVEACARQGAALLLTLSVDGQRGFLEAGGRRRADPEDAWAADLFHRHQRRDKGLGAALGPAAPACLVRILHAHGYQVHQRPSPWCLQAGNEQARTLGVETLDGWRDALLEQAPGEADRILAWHRARRAALLDHRLGLWVGHQDAFARPRVEWPG